MSQYPYTIVPDSISVVVKGQTHTVKRGSPNFKGLREALVNEDWDAVPGFLTVAKSIESWAKGNFKVSGDQILFKGEGLPARLNTRILAMVTADEDPSVLLNFWERLQQNPSWRSVEQLFPFLEHEGIPLTPEGFILAYKSVTRDYKDHHTRSVDNRVGVVVRMRRNQISDDPQEACHKGLHVGALAYAQNFHGGERIIICKVDPQHVVCIPYDESQQKMRVCEYEVLGEYGAQLPSVTFREDDVPPVHDEDEAEWEDDDESFDDDEQDDESFDDEDEQEDDEDEQEDEDDDRPTQVRKPAPRVKSRLDKLDEPELLDLPLDELRQYATHNLRIVGASKIPGGKRALVEAILRVR